MEKIICDRCGREIPHDDTENIGIDVESVDGAVGYDLCADCAKAFDEFMQKKDPCERCGRMCSLPDKSEGLPEGAKDGAFTVRDITGITGVPQSTLRRMLARIGAESDTATSNNHLVVLYRMTLPMWRELADVIKHYSPRPGGRR